MFRIVVTVAVALSSLVVLMPPDAEACINSIARTKERAKPHVADSAKAKPGVRFRSKHPERVEARRIGNSMPELEGAAERAQQLDAAATGREQIEKAIDDLNDGRNHAVIRRMYAVHGASLNQWALNPKITNTPQRDVVHLVALATLRTEGIFYRDHTAALAPPDVHGQNIKWAVIALENLAFVNAVPERHRAEAWARDPALQDAALAKLQALKKADKLESPFQYEALARLLESKGEHARATEARSMAQLKSK